MAKAMERKESETCLEKRREHQKKGAKKNEKSRKRKKSCHVIVGIVKMLSAIITSHDFGLPKLRGVAEQRGEGGGYMMVRQGTGGVLLA